MVGARHAHSIEDETWDRGTAGLSHAGMRGCGAINQGTAHTSYKSLRRHARTPRARAGVRVAAARARHAGARPHAGRGTHARRHGAAALPGGGRAGGRRARAARVELSSILGGLPARTRGTPAHLRQSFPPPLPASRLEGGSTSAGVGARRALGMVAAIWGRRGMVGGTAVINQALQGR